MGKSEILLSGASQMLFVPILLAHLLTSDAYAQSLPASGTDALPAAASRVVPYRYQTHHDNARTWGVGSLAVKSEESGAIIQFSYQVLDPERARILNEVRSRYKPSLIDPQAAVKLIPASLEKVDLSGQIAPRAGEVIRMAFANPGRHVQAGHRVNVIIGQFRAEGLIVQ